LGRQDRAICVESHNLETSADGAIGRVTEGFLSIPPVARRSSPWITRLALIRQV